MNGFKQSWQDYEKILQKFGYTEEQISAVKEVRESDKYEHVTFEQFSELVAQGVVVRTRKLKKKKRNLYIGEDGKFLYLNHFNKRWEWIGNFPPEEITEE